MRGFGLLAIGVLVLAAGCGSKDGDKPAADPLARSERTSGTGNEAREVPPLTQEQIDRALARAPLEVNRQ